MRIGATSDLHGYLPAIEPCDMLLVGGDICPITDHTRKFQWSWLEDVFRRWCDAVPSGRIIVTPGNHDFALEDEHRLARSALRERIVVDRLIQYRGLKIWCSPWSLQFGDWAFMEDESQLAGRYEQIPAGVDVLLSHGPIKGVLDRTINGDLAGSQSLANATRRIKPRYLICGHIHEGYGQTEKEGTVLMNVSHCNEKYEPVNGVVYFEM